MIEGHNFTPSNKNFTSNLHGGLDDSFVDCLQNGVITHVHSLWNNGFISWTIIIQTSYVMLPPESMIQSYVAFKVITNICSWSSQIWLLFPFHHFFSLKNSLQSDLVFYRRNKTSHFLCEFCLPMLHFPNFHIPFFGESSWNNWIAMNWISTSLVDMDSKLVTEL